MADRYFFDGGVDSNTSTIGNWSNVTGGPTDGAGVPGAGDTAYFDSNSPNATVDAALGCANLATSSGAGAYTGTLTMNADVTLTAVLDLLGCGVTGASDFYAAGPGGDIQGTDFTGYTGIIFLTGDSPCGEIFGTTNPPAITVNSGVNTVQIGVGGWDVGAITMQGGTLDDNGNDIACTSFTMAAATLAGSGTVSVAGAIQITGGANNHTGIISQTDDGNIQIAAGQLATHVQVAAATKTSTLNGALNTKRITIGAGTLTEAGGQTVFLYQSNDAVNNVWSQHADATIAFTTLEIRPTVDIKIGAITAALTLLRIRAFAADKTITAQGDIDLTGGAGALEVYSSVMGDYEKLDMNGHALTCGVITVGEAGDGGGDIHFGEGIIKCTSLAGGALSTAANVVVALESAYIQLSTGTMDFALIDTLTNTACHIVSPTAAAGTVNNVPAGVTPKIHCYGVTDGGVNNAGSIDFDEHAHPGSLMMLGVGI